MQGVKKAQIKEICVWNVLSIDLHMRSRISVDDTLDTTSVEEFGGWKFEFHLITLVTTVKRIFPKA